MPRPILELHRVTAGYQQRPLWHDLDLFLAPGQFAAVIGPTGGGKTTLLKVILGLVPCLSGSVRLAPHTSLGYVPQRETIDWDFPVTAEQVVRMGHSRRIGSWPWTSKKERQEAAAWLARLGLASYARRHISQLSGGQQQRVFLARALVSNPRLLLLDEPTSGVDMQTQHAILHLLRELNAAGMTVLLTTHDLNTVASHVPWVICFNRGIIAQGTPATVLTPAVLRQTYDADMAVIRHGDLTFIANRSLIHRHTTRPAVTTSPRKSADGSAR